MQPPSRLAHLEQGATLMEELLRRKTSPRCTSCGRLADRFHLGQDLAVLCVECAPAGETRWYTLQDLFNEYFATLVLILSTNLIFLGLHALSRTLPEVTACCADLLPDSERLTEESLLVLSLVGRLWQTAAECGFTLPEDSLSQILLGGWKSFR